MRLVQGSHVVVKKLFDHERAYIFQNADSRIIFAIPYEDEFTLIGTTDRDYSGDPAAVAITAEETDYLLRNASHYFRRPVTRDDVVWSYSGVRPLFDDGASKAQEATRDYVLKTEGGNGRAGLLNVFGGKLTTYRRLAEAAAELIGGMIGAKGKPWTGGAPLPGGHMPIAAAATLPARLAEAHPYLPPELASRLARLYGVRAAEILKGTTSLEDLGAGVRRRADRARGALPAGARVGAHRRRCALASHKTWAQDATGRSGCAGGVSGRRGGHRGGMTVRRLPGYDDRDQPGGGGGAMLELDGVEKRVGDEVHVADVSLRFATGTLNVLLGPTLSGKTTLMRLMAGLDKPTAGRVLVNGEDVTAVSVRKRDVAMVYQQFINYPALTVRENIASPMRIAGRAKAEIDATVRRVADLLKLTPFLDRLPLQLSGGQQQRTALARALAKDARLVLLDEPLANLDYKLREELRAELPKIFGASGAVFVYATAEAEEALLLGGNVAVLEEGRVTEFGPTLDVYRRPRLLATARGMSDPPLNWVRVRKLGGVFRAKLPDEPDPDADDVPVPAAFSHLADGAYIIAIRPHHLSLVSTGANDVELDGWVSAVEITGSEDVSCGCAASTTSSWWRTGCIIFARGAMIPVHFDLTRLMVFDDDGARVAPRVEPVAA